VLFCFAKQVSVVFLVGPFGKKERYFPADNELASSAVMWATAYLETHEIKKLIPTYEEMLYYYSVDALTTWWEYG